MSVFPFEAAWFDLGPDGAKRTSCAAALACAQQNRQRRPARIGWHSFGEYAFLEDSRYASQRKNVRRKPNLRYWQISRFRAALSCSVPIAVAVFLTGNNRQYFSCQAIIAFAGRARAQGSPYSWSAQVSVD
jgi:hypothetical protein